MSDNVQLLHSAWFIRCGEPPRANQRLTIVNGVLQEVTAVPADERSLIRPLAVLPGLVNAHTHLEFSDLREPLKPPSPFPDWIRSVVTYRRGDLAEDSAIAHAVESGLTECRALGTLIVGEICTSDTGRDALIQVAADSCEGEPAVVCFRELLGFTSDRIMQQRQLANRFVDGFAASSDVTAGVLPALSPHAPYSVHPDIVDHACLLSKKCDIPIAMHLAETTDELEFVESRAGRFVQFLDRIGLWQPESLHGISGIADYLSMLQKGAHALAIHGNYFSADDIQVLGQSPNISTVYCVRTHRWFGHQNHPWRQIEAAGGRVILGTDSRASNPDLSIWKELQTFCEMNPSESLIGRLPMITTDAAAALGIDPSSVNLQIGASFHATVVATEARTQGALEASLMESTANIASIR